MTETTIRGYAWLVFPTAKAPGDRADPGEPFGDPAARGGATPGGVVDFWPVPTEFGTEGGHAGTTFLVATETAEPPPVRETYEAEPAKLQPGFKAAGGLVRVKEVLGTRKGPGGGEVRLCQFEAEGGPPEPPRRTAPGRPA